MILQNLCKACHKTLLSIDEVEIQLAEMKEDITGKFKKTEAMLQSGELPPSAEEPPLPQKKKSVAIKQEAIDVSLLHSIGENQF